MGRIVLVLLLLRASVASCQTSTGILIPPIVTNPDILAYTSTYQKGDILLVEDLDFTAHTWDNNDDGVEWYNVAWQRQDASWLPFEHLDDGYVNHAIFPMYGDGTFGGADMYSVNHRNPPVDDQGLHFPIEEVINNHVSSVEIHSAHSYKYGFYEVEAKLPQGDGIVSAFWLYSDRAPISETCDENGQTIAANWQEIDVWETNGKFTDGLRGNLHFTKAVSDKCHKDCDRCQRGYSSEFESTDFANEFHTFTLFWDPHRVITFVDGHMFRYWVKNPPVNKKKGSLSSIKYRDAMIINLAAGPWGDNPYDSGGNLNSLHGPETPYSLPFTEMVIKRFRHWVVIPKQTSVPTQRWDMAGENFHPLFHGKYMTGNTLTFQNFDVGPVGNWNATGTEWEPDPFKFGHRFEAIGTDNVVLKPGFKARGAKENRRAKNIFRARIVPTGSVPVQALPNIWHLGSGSPYMQNFWSNLSTNQSISFSNAGPYKTLNQPATEHPMHEGEEHLRIKVYPNPTQDLLNVELNDEKSYPVQLVAPDGRVVLKQRIDTGQNQLNMSQLKAGIYFLQIPELQHYFKVVKE